MVRDEAYYRSITEAVIGCAYKVANTLGPGFLEKVYENALFYEMTNAGLRVAQQYPVKVMYEGTIVGEYFADIFVEGEVIVELKAVKSLEPSHFAQLMNYLKATGVKVGLLINFSGLKIQIKRVVNGL